MVELVSSYGVYGPEDVDFLRSVYKEIRASCRPLEDEDEQAVARRLLVLYGRGSRDRELLKLTAGGAGSVDLRRH